MSDLSFAQYYNFSVMQLLLLSVSFVVFVVKIVQFITLLLYWK